jgi:hypothetical protein
MIALETINALNDSTTRLFRELGRFDSHSFNLSLGDRWNPGQIAEHILLTDIAVFRVLQGPLSFAGRKTDEKLPEIQQVWTDRSQKLEALPANIPSDQLKDPVTMQGKIMRERNEMIQFLKTVEEDSLCISRPHRFHGELTMSEWIWFVIYHTDRHIEQVKEIEAEK